ncbi:hypothetical protein [Miltoncostaea oceani]|uniref:hypothetical protein n=1 Tax=Miltoncostaea oceani TaxID=2843216 RepID=UPI001C3C595C|nr:hypothetical protein [Miltoncostaea oceani]
MAAFELVSDDGHRLLFDLSDEGVIVNLACDRPLKPGELVSFRGPVPDHLEPTGLPAHIVALAERRGRRVCAYTSDGVVCWCNGEGGMTCEARR